MFKLPIAFLALVFLSACTTGSKVTTLPVEPIFTTLEAESKVQKYVVLTSRTLAFDETGKRVDMPGVPCFLQGEEFVVSYITPANVRLPVFGLDTSELSMICEFGGEQKYHGVGVRNLTAENISNSGASGGIIGSVMAMSLSAARGNRPNDDYTYDKLVFTLNDKVKNPDRDTLL